MKKRNRIASLLLTAAMILAATAPAASAAETKKLTIKSPEAGHTYEAYQIFGGTYAPGTDGKSGILSDIVWGSGVDATKEVGGKNVLAALKAEDKIGTFFAKADSAAGVAEALQGKTDDTANFPDGSEEVDKFAAVMEQYLTTTYAETTQSADKDEDGKYLYEATMEPGYYLVKDKDASLDGQPAKSYTKFMLDMVEDQNVEAKADAPDIEKKVLDADNKPGDANETIIGTEVTFQLTSRVPKMDGYDSYWFVVKDTLSKGLEFKKDTVKITVAGTELQPAAYEVTPDGSASDVNGTKVEIVLKDFYNSYKDNANAEIVITYNAVLTKDAVVGDTGNMNSVTLVYSNNPNYTYDGDKPDPDKENPPTGETTEKTTETYTAQIKLLKQDDKNNSLTGATFKLTGMGVAAVITTDTKTVTTYEKAADGAYVIGDDGAMREYNAATDDSKDRYNKVEGTAAEITETTKEIPAEITNEVDKDGVLEFTGLGAGKYTISEVKAPTGYNKLSGPINVEISFNAADNNKWSYVYSGAATGNGTATDGVVQVNVVNKQGAMLPSTGGTGTVLFTVSGLALMLAAVVVLAAKNKKKPE